MTAEESSVSYTIPAEVERRENTLGRFTALFAEGLPDDFRATAFCGPTSFRDPEADNVWHAYMIQSGFPVLLKDQGPLLIRALIGGFKRFISGRFGLFTFVPHEQASVLGIAPASVCKQKNGGVETTYCLPEDTNRMAWLLADDTGANPGGYQVSRFDVLLAYFKMLRSWMAVSLSCPKDDRRMDWVVGAFVTLRWIFSLVWVNKWMLALEIRQTLKKERPKQVHCVHEMHPHSRIAWIEAKRVGIPTITVQHASIVRSKLWYFPTQEELAAGMATPDEIEVFSEEVQELFRSFFPAGTRYHLCCGPRYVQWKETNIKSRQEKSEGAPILFAGSLPWWDNMIVLKAVKQLIDAPQQRRPIWVRLHPAGQIPLRWKRWLDRMAETGKVTMSMGPLEEAIRDCVAVVGMNTTVLEEAALMGAAVLVLESEDYLSFATKLGRHIPLGQFTWLVVEETISMMEVRGQEMTQHGRELLGIDHPVFRIH